MTEDLPSQEFDPEKIRAGSRSTHRVAGVITAFGVYVYLVITGLFVYLHALGVLEGRLIMTIPADTTLALLGVAATVLIAFVASLWTSIHSVGSEDPARSGGRRLVLVNVILLTGGGCVCVAIAGALDGWGKDFNAAVSVAVVGLSVALAYVAAETSEFIKRDQRLNQTLSQSAQHSEVNRMRTARQCWLKRTSLACLREPRNRWLARLRQNLACVAALAALQCLTLVAWSAREDVARSLALTVGCVVWSLVGGQLLVHHAAVCFVRRNWWPLSLVGLLSLMALLVDVGLALGVTSYLEQSAGMPSIVAAALAWPAVFFPLLLCVAGLTVAPNGLRRHRPLTVVRWGVIWAMSRHVEKLSRDESEEGSGVRGGQPAAMSRRLRTAIRTATGVEPLEPTP